MVIPLVVTMGFNTAGMFGILRGSPILANLHELEDTGGTYHNFRPKAMQGDISRYIPKGFIPGSSILGSWNGAPRLPDL